MTRPLTRSQDGGPPSTVNNQAADITPQPPHNSKPEIVQSQDQSTIVDDHHTTAPQANRHVNANLFSPFFLSIGDHPGLVLVSTVLNDNNYQSCKRGITMVLVAKNKIAFIDGSLPLPEISNPYLNS
uniref:Retrotransposon Copia-like N-terminal domain-containing protein n=1 Tax=Cannabis sativa TaxID=3483 RepID=A0A803QST2_CANSA